MFSPQDNGMRIVSAKRQSAESPGLKASRIQVHVGFRSPSTATTSKRTVRFAWIGFRARNSAAVRMILRCLFASTVRAGAAKREVARNRTSVKTSVSSSIRIRSISPARRRKLRSTGRRPLATRCSNAICSARFPATEVGPGPTVLHRRIPAAEVHLRRRCPGSAPPMSSCSGRATGSPPWNCAHARRRCTRPYWSRNSRPVAPSSSSMGPLRPA